MSEASLRHCPECQAELPAEGFAGLCPRCVAGTLSGMWELLQPESRAQPGLKEDEVRPEVAGWRVLTPIGAGGQGIVWRAVRLDDDALGAVKVFRSEDGGDGVEGAARMEAEVAALRALQHESIVKVLDSGVAADGRFFIITEFVEGCDLHRLLQVEKVSPERAFVITRQVAAAIAHAHAQGIVHRDLKPANVLVGRDGLVRLADFSLARQIGARVRRVTLTEDGAAFGTPYYLAPEVMRGEPATAAADLYALGVMLYEMLTGAPPAGRFVRASKKCEVPPETDTLIESLLAERPERRPADSGAVMRRLGELSARCAGVAAARERRQRLRTVAALAASGIVAAAIGYSIPRPVPPPPPPPRLNAKNFQNPAAATRVEPWVNGLKMGFIPVDGAPGVLIARHETTMAQFIQSMTVSGDDAEWFDAYGAVMVTRKPLEVLTAAGWKPLPKAMPPLRMMESLGLPPQAAASGISVYQARRFCAWLTWREQREGRLQAGQYYRLPTDLEWSAAGGVSGEKGTTAELRHLSLGREKRHFSWGVTWPPFPGVANYAGTEARQLPWPAAWTTLAARNDDHPRTAPVGRFAPSEAGFFDLSGNVWEWCEARKNDVSAEMVLRGASWADGGNPEVLRLDYRRFERPNARESNIGFRCVLVVPDLPVVKKSDAG